MVFCHVRKSLAQSKSTYIYSLKNNFPENFFHWINQKSNYLNSISGVLDWNKCRAQFVIFSKSSVVQDPLRGWILVRWKFINVICQLKIFSLRWPTCNVTLGDMTTTVMGDGFLFWCISHVKVCNIRWISDQN